MIVFLLLLKPWPNGKCLATKHHQSLFGNQTFYCLATLPKRNLLRQEAQSLKTPKDWRAFRAMHNLLRTKIKLDSPRAYTGLPVLRVTQKQKRLCWVVLNCSISVNFASRGSLRPFKGSPRSRTSRGPLAHSFMRRNRSFSQVKNLATGLLVICQKGKIPVIFTKNRHALLTCGSAVTQRFIPYCQLS